MNFKKSTLAALAVVALGAVSTQANAFGWYSDNGTFSSFAGVTNIDFTSAATGTVSNYVASNATFNFGAVYDASVPQSAQPSGATGNFWSVGTSSEQVGPGTVTLSTPVKYYGFLWGSSDIYNTVTFSVFNTLLGSTSYSLTGLDVPSGTGDQSISRYLNVFAGNDETITGISFSSTGNAFETDNHAYSVTAVPEVETYAMMLAGLGLMGTIARRRNKSKAV